MGIHPSPIRLGRRNHYHTNWDLLVSELLDKDDDKTLGTYILWRQVTNGLLLEQVSPPYVMQRVRKVQGVWSSQHVYSICIPYPTAYLFKTLS